MPRNVDKKYGKLKRSPGPYPIICTVYANLDPTNQGILQVYPSENLDTNTDKPATIKVKRLSSYFGATRPSGADGDWGDYTSNPSSYGQWNSPPDVGTQVICIFVNGDPNYGYYIGAVPDATNLTMVPAIGGTENVTLNAGESASYGGATRLPVTNINTKNPELADTVDFLSAAKPVHSYVASIMQQQGILRDKYRGPISSSANRETPSRVGWGVSTPGRPIYEGGFTDETLASELDGDPQDYNIIARRGGHSLVMDDGDVIGRDQLIRLRTALGHQILMSDDGQMLSILHSNGQSYIELGKEGTVDIYGSNSINLRTQGDLNLHADNDLNLHAGRNVNIKATENMSVGVDKKYSQRVGEDYALYSLANITVKADAAIGLDASGQVGLTSAAEICQTGLEIQLNGTAASLTADKVEPIELTQHPDTLFDKTVGWAAALASLNSITTRVPAHMPWMAANQGVDVTVEAGADEALADAPAGDVSALNALASATNQPGVTGATSASVPEVGAISGSLDKNATTSMLGGIATAAAGTVAGAVATGTQVVTDAAGGLSASIGSFGQTPSQLSSGGVLKPGADTMVNTLVSTGTSIKDAMPTSAFTGKNGANNLTSLIQNPATQAKSVVSNLQKGQTALTNVGAITGKETSTAIAGVVAGTGTSSVGNQAGALNATVGATTDAVKSLAGGGAVGSAIGGAKDTLNAIGQGATSALASTLSGGLGGITKALDTLGKAELPNIAGKFDVDLGAVASSFKSITSTFKPLKVGVPQDLGAIAEEIAGEVAGAAEGVTGADLASLSVDTSLAENAIAGAKDQVASLAGSATGLANTGGLASAAKIVSKGASATTAAVIASGVSNLPGGQKIAGGVVDNAKGVSNAVADGLSSVTATVGGLAASAFSGKDPSAGIKDLLGDASAKLGGLSSQLSGALSPGAAAALVSALASLTSGGGSTVKLPTVAKNTFGARESISGLVDNVLGNPKIPRPNLLGEISDSALSAFKSLKSLKATLAEKTKAVATEEKKIAGKQAKYAELLSTLPAGSPEIARAKQEYESAVSSPAYKNAILEAKAVSSEIGAGITPAIQTPKNLDQFSELEELITTTAENSASQQLNNESNSNAAPETTQLVDLADTFNPIFDDGLNTYSIITDEDVVIPGGSPVVDNTVDGIVGPPTVPPNIPGGGGGTGGGCVLLDSYIPLVESEIFNGREIKQAYQLREGYAISLNTADEELNTYIGSVVFNVVDLQPCVRIETAQGISLNCSTTAPIFTKDSEFVDAPDLMNKQILCMKDDKEFWDEVVSIESIGEKFVAVINAGDTAFWAGEQDGSYVLHHNIDINHDRFLSTWKKK
tara:strand:+ start:4527 stop:8549 length:4023 start_codon:yes stop_codon:yes gene_type:complete